MDVTGGRVTSLVVDGMELLVTTAPGVIDRGLYPMAPFAGRIDHGTFVFGGREYHLPANLPPHAIHGTVLETEWSTDASDAASWRGSVALEEPWPLGGRVHHELRLASDSLTARLEVRNDERPMPATCGWHPWWRRRLPRGADLVLDVDLEHARMYRRAGSVATGELVAPGPPPWDDCFTGLRGPPVLRWPGALSITCEATADHWVLFTEPHDAVCVEPQTGPPNACNIGVGVTVVESGRPLIAGATWRWRLG